MKKIFLVMMVFFCAAFLQSQEPPVIDLTVFSRSYIENGLNNDLGYDHGFLKTDAFRLWGWSKNGNIAYTIVDSQNWRGSRITEAIIFNLVEDKMIWQYIIYSDQHYDEKTKTDRYEEEYKDFMAEFIAVSAYYGIEPVIPEFQPLPVIHNNNAINIAVKTAEIPNWSDNEDFWIKFYSYDVIAERGGRQKTIGTVARPNALSVVPLGFFKSPFEDRALIVVAHFQYMLEAECWMEYKFFGCHLTAGF